MSNRSIWPIDGTLTSATSPRQSRPGSNGNERVLRIPQSSSIIGASPSDCHIQDTRCYGGAYSSAEMPLVYSTAPADWANKYE